MFRHQPTWLIREEYRETLSPATLNRLVNREGVRHSLSRRELPTRTVTRLEPASPELPPLYLKEYRFLAFPGRIQCIFRTPADKEWNTALHIEARGILTFEPLAVGTRRRWGLPDASYLVSKEIEHARSLKDHLLDQACRNDQAEWTARHAVLCSLARFVQVLHRRGILHRDFHWENILVDARDPRHIRWYLMDLHRVTLLKRLRDRARVANLAALGTAFRYTTRKTERLRFLVQYAQGDTLWEKRIHHFARLIENRSYRMIQKIWIRKERRCLRHNKYFTPFRTPACRGFINREHSSPDLLGLLQDPGRAFSAPGSVPVKDSRTTSSCTLPVQMAGETVPLFIKRYNYQNFFYALKHLFRRSRGNRAWKTAHALLARDIPAPLPIAYAEKRRARLLRESFVITRHIALAAPLSKALPENATEAAGHAIVKTDLIRHAASLVRLMHDRGIWHRDLKAANIVVQPLPENGLQFYLTDLDSIRIMAAVRPDQRIRDLSRLNRSLISVPAISLRDRLRFLQWYLGTGTRGDKILRTYWEKIRRETAKKLAKIEKNL